LSHLYIKPIILPRQARDKHRETHSKKEWRFSSGDIMEMECWRKLRLHTLPYWSQVKQPRTKQTKQNKTTHTKMRRPSLNLLSFLSSPIPAGAGAAAVAAAACVTCVTAAAGSSLHVVAPGPGLGPSLLRETNPSAEAIA